MLVALIPAYNPTMQLVSLVCELSKSAFDSIIVVNDGSTEDCSSVFEEIKRRQDVTVLKHTVNLGKGAALKTGLSHAYRCLPALTGVVTIDADGQHLIADAVTVARALADQPLALAMGTRTFDRATPFRSAFGNVLTQKLFRLLVGIPLTDTQSGLRGIPRDFIPTLMTLDANGYEFELEMLLACKFSKRKIVEREIHTVYIEENIDSHFNPIRDSLKIYFVLFRFVFIAVLAAFIDYSVFLFVFGFGSGIALSQISARLVAMSFNYLAVGKLLSYSQTKRLKVLTGYALLTFISGGVSYSLINLIVGLSLFNVPTAKIISEILMFFVNFVIQRDFIFTKKQQNTPYASA